MKSKVFKVAVVLLIIFTMTMANFIFVGHGLISYAANDVSTNNNNVQFDSYFKNEKGEKVASLDISNPNNLETSLFLYLSVKNEGYLNAEINLKDTNFIVKSSTSEYVNTIKDNIVKLNQINAGTEIEIELKVEFMRKEEMDINLLSKESKVILSGTYKDSSERNKNVNATKNVTLKLISTTNPASVINDFKIITNKILRINNEEKRVVQVSLKTGLKNNSYPIKNIVSEISIPKTAEAESVETVKNYIKLNNMTKWNLENNSEVVKITMENERGLWKTTGEEEIILTYIYDKDVDLDETEIIANTKLELYDNTIIDAMKSKASINSQEELDTVMSAEIINTEPSIYKGKINKGIDREITHITKINVNLSDAIEKLEVNEMPSTYDENLDANTYYKQTVINKEELNKVLGENGILKIIDENGNTLKEINKDAEANSDGNIVIAYEENTVKQIKIQILVPEKEGIVNIESTKVIKKANVQDTNALTSMDTRCTYNYNDSEVLGEKTSKVELKNTTTSAKIQINKSSLSTLTKNNVEIKVMLKSSSEENDLYKNPTITIELPKEVEQININENDVKLLYEDELKIKDYSVNANTITINLEGEQTQYKEATIEGANILINAELVLNRKAPSVDSQIIMRYQNQNASSYVRSAEVGEEIIGVKVEAPTDITVVNTIKELLVEEIGENGIKEIKLDRGQEAKEIEPQIEIINNRNNSIKNVKILGEFPTKNSKNNIDIKILQGIQIENAEVYYTENENATEDLENSENNWTKNLSNMNNVKKYLIVVEEIKEKGSILASYKAEIPANLEYSLQADEGYEIIYTDGVTNVENKVVATSIRLTTGNGAIIESKLAASVGNNSLENLSEVVAGEVIKYTLEVSNNGTEDISNPVEVSSLIPEGTKYVEPKENYEYTGSSYYKELDNKEFKSEIKELKAGEKVTIEYEVRVNSDIKNNQKIVNSYKTTYNGVTKTSNELQLTSKAGNIRVSVKRVTDRKAKLYVLTGVDYYAIIENTTNEIQKDVKIKNYFSDNIEVDRVHIMTGVEDIDVTDDDLIDATESTGDYIDKEENDNENDEGVDEEDNFDIKEIEYEDEIEIGDLNPGESKVISYDVLINKEAKNNISFYVIADQNGSEYRSNVWKDDIIGADIKMNMTSNISDRYIKSGDELEYTIIVENKNNMKLEDLTILDSIPNELTIQSVKVNDKEDTLPTNNDVMVHCEVEPNNTAVVKISTVVDYSEARTEAKEINNNATAMFLGETLSKTADVSHIVEADPLSNEENNEGNGDNPNNNGNEDNPNNNGEGSGENNGNSGEVNNNNNGNVANGNRLINGIVWLDENNNGKKDTDEKGIKDVKINLLNVETNQLVKDSSGNILEVKTSENGSYIINNIRNGKYIVIFNYNDKSYSTTKYKAQGVMESENSDAIKSTLTINGETKEVFATDTIQINGNNISDINIGFIKLKNFDLKLDKYISKITVSNRQGTTVKEFSDQTLAKIEIDSKTIENSTVVIEYTIRISNVGEIEGYAKQVADYIPSDLNFNSELNKDWYQSGTNLYNTSLSNQKIMPGEYKDLKLTLIKTMTLNNIGLVNNTAEIVQDYNELDIKDSNSTPGNKTQNENDMGLADTIIAIRTGGEMIYLSIAIMALIIAMGVILTPTISKRNINKKHKFDKI